MKKGPILRVTVEQEPDTGAYFASWESTERNGVSGYSSTPIGAVASALHTMILVAEDRVRDIAVRESSERMAVKHAASLRRLGQ